MVPAIRELPHGDSSTLSRRHRPLTHAWPLKRHSVTDCILQQGCVLGLFEIKAGMVVFAAADISGLQVGSCNTRSLRAQENTMLVDIDSSK